MVRTEAEPVGGREWSGMVSAGFGVENWRTGHGRRAAKFLRRVGDDGAVSEYARHRRACLFCPSSVWCLWEVRVLVSRRRVVM